MKRRVLRANRSQRRRGLLAEKLEPRWLLAGPYAPAAGQAGSDAVHYLDPSIEGWATAVVQYQPGSNVDQVFQDSTNAMGPAGAVATDTVSLGRGGSITLTFADPIRDGLGVDFAVFENGVTDTFLELAFVEVSSDGVHFFRFDNDSLTASPVEAFGAVDPTNVRNLAGKYRVGFGTPFDLEELRGRSPLLDLTRVTHVRIVDVVGDGSAQDSSGRLIYDPYPTVGSAGFDLDGIAVIHSLDAGQDVIDFEDRGATLASESAFFGPDPNGTTAIGAFGDVITVGSFQSERLTFNNTFSNDYGSWNQWAYSKVTNNVTGGFTNQFGAITGGGGNGTETFGVGFVDQGGDYDLPTIRKPADDIRRFASLLVTNTTYAALSMKHGDSFAKQFGGASGNDEDYFLLTITGKDDAGQAIGSVDVYLADYRFADNALDYIVEDWIEVDLRPISQARSLEFSIASSDVGPFGINTPAYFAVDEIRLTTPAIFLDLAEREVRESAGANATRGRISRSDQDTTSAVTVNLAVSQPSSLTIPSTVTIPAGQPYVEFAIGAIDDSDVQGNRSVLINATANQILPDEQTIQILDDDATALGLSFQAETVAEGTSVLATVLRNDANLSLPLTIQVAAEVPSLFSFEQQVVIPAGQSSIVLTIDALEDDIDRDNQDVVFTVSAPGYVAGIDAIAWIDNDRPRVTLQAEASAYPESLARPTVGFENLGRTLGYEDYNNGADLAGGFASSGLDFNNDFDLDYGSWSGWAISNTTDTTTAGFGNQYSAFVGKGAAGSDTYAVASAFGYPALPSIRRDPASTSGFRSIEITNATYAALSMLQGDAFAKQFGGVTGTDPDWLLLTIEGLDANQQSLGTIEFYLADYRFADHSLDYVIDDWTEVSLLPLSQAVELRFSMSSSDVGAFGMNTPAYFAVDQIVMSGGPAAPTIMVSRNSLDVSGDLRVELSSSDTTELRVPAEVLIPAGSRSVTVPLEILHDQWVDGDQAVELSVVADGFDAADLTLSILDSDSRTLSLQLSPDVIDENGGNARAIIHRNVEDVSGPLTVTVSPNPAGHLNTPSQVTIPTGQRSIAVNWSAIDNSLGDGDRMVAVSVNSLGFVAGQDSLLITDDERLLTLELDRNRFGEADAPTTVMFEDLGAKLLPESFYNGGDLAGGFVSGAASFNNSYDPSYGSWLGWSVSNTTDSATPGFGNQYSAVAGEGAYGSDTYAIATAFPGSMVPSINLVDETGGISFESIMVTNTTYAARSMADGDAFAKKFGGASGADADFFLLTIEGMNRFGESVGQVEFYLADYRFADSASDYIVDQWTQVDLRSLQGATQLRFSLDSSDVGLFGMNTPAYFAVDHLVLGGGNRNPISATVSRTNGDLSAPLVVRLGSGDASEVALPSEVTIPAGHASVSFQVDAVDDAIVDGVRLVQVNARADGYLPVARTMVVDDDDQPTLTASVANSGVYDFTEGSSLSLVIHRNTADLSQSLSLQFDVSNGDIAVPMDAQIPVGAASVQVPLTILDNQVRDGDRSVTLAAMAEGMANGAVELTVIDDEQSGVFVEPSGQSTSVGELQGEDEVFVRLVSQPLSKVVVRVESSGHDLRWEPGELTFTPANWNVPQSVLVRGIPDLLLEGDEQHQLSIRVDAENSDPWYADAATSIVNVEVYDQNPSHLRIEQDVSHVLLLDQDTGVELQRGASTEGIKVIANDEGQTIDLPSLSSTIGPIEIELLDGDDIATVRGSQFAMIDGGEGFDTLRLKLDQPIEFAAFLAGRASSFEQYVLDAEGAEVLVTSANLQGLASADGSVLLRAMANQIVAFGEEAILGDAVMHGHEFAQVVHLGNVPVVVISTRPWQNVRSRWDVNASGDVTALDALVVINELKKRGQSELPPIDSLAAFGGSYFDVSGDGLLSSLDALQVINEMARRDFSASGEWLVPMGRSEADPTSSTRLLDATVSMPSPNAQDKIMGSGDVRDQALLEVVQENDADEADWTVKDQEANLSASIQLLQGEGSSEARVFSETP